MNQGLGATQERLQTHTHLQVLGQPSRLQVNPVLIGSQLPPLHFLIMKLELHLCSRRDVHLGLEALHVKGLAPKRGSLQCINCLVYS